MSAEADGDDRQEGEDQASQIWPSDSRTWRSHVEQVLGNVVQITRSGRTASLAVVDTYKHVGTHGPINTSLGVEIKTRADAVWGKLQPLVRKLFRSPSIRLDVKRQALQAYFLSSQLFQAGCWPLLNQSEYQKCKSVVMRAYKLVAFDRYSEHRDNVENHRWEGTS